MADDRSVVIKIEGNSKALRDEFDRVKKQTKNLDDTLKSVAKRLNNSLCQHSQQL